MKHYSLHPEKKEWGIKWFKKHKADLIMSENFVIEI